MTMPSAITDEQCFGGLAWIIVSSHKRSSCAGQCQSGRCRAGHVDDVFIAIWWSIVLHIKEGVSQAGALSSHGSERM